MKKLTTLLLLLISVELFANELAWVDEQIAAIKPARVGIANKKISKLKNPFIFLHRTEIKKKSTTRKYSRKSSRRRYRYSRKFSLEAVLNKSVLINGKWYKKGEKIHGYKIEKIKFHSVLLKKGTKMIFLSTEKKNNHIKINNK
jgi:hypothetical protein